MGLALGGITTPICNLLEKGLIRKVVDTRILTLERLNLLKRIRTILISRF